MEIKTKPVQNSLKLIQIESFRNSKNWSQDRTEGFLPQHYMCTYLLTYCRQYKSIVCFFFPLIALAHLTPGHTRRDDT